MVFLTNSWHSRPIPMQNDLLQATHLAGAGQWNAAHELVQQHETDMTAAWIHAVLHKIEGDQDNSRYWYRRAGTEVTSLVGSESDGKQLPPGNSGSLQVP